MSTRKSVWIAALAVIAVVMGLMSATAGAASGPVVPAQDPFYTPTGTTWESTAPGTVLDTRQVKVSLLGTLGIFSATQVLYRTTNELGGPSATVATIIHPLVSTGATKLLSYQTFYDGDGSGCRPSYTLQSNNPTNTSGDLDQPFMASYLAQGYTLVTSDYEGPTDDYGAGQESGMATLDAIVAAEQSMNLSAKTTPVAMLGYSGGATATEWAAELQPTYAPQLDIIGSAAGGIPADFWHNLAYINGSSDWSGAMPSVLLGLMRAYKLNLATYLSGYGQEIMAQVAPGCLNPSAYPGLHYQSMFLPQYQDFSKVPLFTKIFNNTIMGRLSLPHGPQLMGVGDSDGTGDGVMVAADVENLAYGYCQRGDNVTLHVYTGSNHDVAAFQFEPAALSFINDLYAGKTPGSGCASIPQGDSMAPVPMPVVATPTPKLALRSVAANAHHTIVNVAVRATVAIARGVKVELLRGKTVVAQVSVPRLSAITRHVRLTLHGRAFAAGRYTVAVMYGGRRVLSRQLVLRTQK